jgi:hypothetical protein
MINWGLIEEVRRVSPALGALVESELVLAERQITILRRLCDQLRGDPVKKPARKK